MTKKKLITQWHDGLIEPGMRWREEIEENLARMDVFVGLLTNAFINSDFIEKVEIKAARKKLQEQRKDFFFVLILVNNISLLGLDLAEYQVLKPGGKAVCEHASRKAGFNVAQKELEQLILNRQAVKKAQKHGELAFEPRVTRTQEKDGITIIVQGDYIGRDKPMTHDHSIHIGGNVTNAQVGQTLTNCTNMIQQQAPGERKDLLEELEKQVQQLLKALPAEKQEEAAGNVELAVKAATSAKPNRAWYSVSTEGLLEAAKFVEDFSGNIAGTIKNLGKSLWPDFLLPESE
ncbi:MAG: toll/interleukin-1 receptor domain-containing protein [Pseudomonadota bacterium]|nr:toll/interleukin-1 receptor domain-containing protein [Pseudomonadota bacterium]